MFSIIRLNFLSIAVLFSILFNATSCKKSENIIIPDNQVPYYEGITTLQVQTYVSKAFIDITGREPDVSERDSWVAQLKNNGLDSAFRAAFIGSIQQDPSYSAQFNNVYIAPMFDGIYDSLAAVAQINELAYFRSLAVANADSIMSAYWAYEINKMELVRDASYLYHSGQIGIDDFKSRMADNYIYDQINMGVTNYVISCFENYFKRLPTDQEQQNSETMINGQAARIFMRDGSSKSDFLSIMTSEAAFYEGIVIDTYRHLLARNPNSAEMGEYTSKLADNITDIKELQLLIAVSDEYAGF